MNIRQETIKALESEGYIVGFTDSKGNDVTPKKAIELSLTNPELGLIGYTLKVPKAKEVDVQWIMNKLNKQSSFINLANYINKFANSVVYAASYGIGVTVILGFNFDKVAEIREKLNQLNVSFYEEYSSEGLVYRFVISKSKENLKKVSKINA